MSAQICCCTSTDSHWDIDALSIATHTSRCREKTTNDFLNHLNSSTHHLGIEINVFLRRGDLLHATTTSRERIMHSLRHTYATIALERDKVPVHTLTKQMGTSVKMIELHYSHLDAVKAIDQLRGEDSLSLLQDHTLINDRYAYQPEMKIGRKIVKKITKK